MLDNFRKFQRNFVFGIIVFAIVAVMALYGLDQMVSSDSNAGTVAWVNGEPIPSREFQRALENTVEDFRERMGQQLDERFIEQFQIPQRTLEDMVQFKLVTQEAANLGFRVSDKALASFIRQAPAFQRDGRFDAELYRTIPNRGLEEKRFRESLLVRRMQTYLADRITLTPNMVDRELDLKETKVNVKFARVDFASLVGDATPSAAQTAAFLKETPQADLKAYYDSHRRDFTIPAAVNLRQIRVGVPFQASAEAKAQALEKIQKIAQGLTAESFEQAARKSSDDEHAKKGGAVGWVDRGVLEPALEQAIDALEVGQISAPIETSFGYYLLLVTEKRPETVRPLDEVKETIAAKLWSERRKESLIAEKKKEWEALLAQGRGLEPQLAAAKIDIKATGPFGIGQGYIPQIGQNDAMLDAIFKLTKENPVAPALYANGKDYYYLRLDSVERPSAKNLQDRQAAAASLETVLQSTFLNAWIEDLKKGSKIRIEASFAPKQPSPFAIQ